MESLKIQTADTSRYNILIVNNHPDPVLRENIASLCHEVSHCTVIQEASPGLSRARNTGYGQANTVWIGYIDDDCIVPEDFVEKALSIIDQDRFDCFGGHIASWWLYDRPKWLPRDFGSKPKLTIDISTIEEGYNWGGNMFFKKSALAVVNGFDEDVGMNAGKIGYSAENRVQQRLRQSGFTIGYDPNLEVQHLVGKHKLNPKWHLKAAFAEGRDARNVFPEQYTFSYLAKEGLRIPITWFRSLVSFYSRRDYYWQNLYIDCCKPFYRLSGKLSSFLMR